MRHSAKGNNTPPIDQSMACFQQARSGSQQWPASWRKAIGPKPPWAKLATKRGSGAEQTPKSGAVRRALPAATACPGRFVSFRLLVPCALWLWCGVVWGGDADARAGGRGRHGTCRATGAHGGSACAGAAGGRAVATWREEWSTGSTCPLPMPPSIQHPHRADRRCYFPHRHATLPGRDNNDVRRARHDVSAWTQPAGRPVMDGNPLRRMIFCSALPFPVGITYVRTARWKRRRCVVGTGGLARPPRMSCCSSLKRTGGPRRQEVWHSRTGQSRAGNRITRYDMRGQAYEPCGCGSAW